MPQQPPSAVPGSRLPLFAVALTVVLIDQITKLAVRGLMSPSRSIPIVPHVLYLTYVRNAGAAFGLLPGRQLFFFATTGAVIGFIIAYGLRARPTDRLLMLALGLELGGAVGNLIDRAVFGRVTDFLDVRFWPVFNVADSSIVVGLALIAIFALRGRRQSAGRQQEAA